MNTQRISLGSAFLAFLALAYIYFPESIDDAYITLRYSRNLFLGNGPIFNIGERVEGYSNFSWMVLLAAIGRLGAPMEIAMKWLSLISGIAVLALVWKFSARHFKSVLVMLSAVIILAVSSFFTVWSVDGLETMFYTMLLTWLVYALGTDRTNAWLIGIIASLVALTRPEGIMFALVAVTFLAFRQGLASSLKAILMVAIFAGSYEIFRLNYFGEFVPNTGLNKVHMSLNAAWDGLRYLFSYNAESGFLLLPAAIIGAASFKKNVWLRIPILFFLAQVVFIMVSGGDFMFAYRFIIPVMPCIALLCASAIEMLYEWMNSKFALLGLIVIASSQAVSQYSALPEKHIGFDNFTFRSASLFSIADFLAQRSSPADWILLSEAGIIPFYVNAQVRDYMGLTSSFYSTYKPLGIADGKYVLDSNYLFSVRPKFVIISFTEDENGSISSRMKVESKVLASSKFSFYKPIGEFDIPKNTSFLNAIYYKYPPKNIKRIFFTVFERSSDSQLEP